MVLNVVNAELGLHVLEPTTSVPEPKPGVAAPSSPPRDTPRRHRHLSVATLDPIVVSGTGSPLSVRRGYVRDHIRSPSPTVSTLTTPPPPPPNESVDEKIARISSIIGGLQRSASAGLQTTPPRPGKEREAGFSFHAHQSSYSSATLRKMMGGDYRPDEDKSNADVYESDPHSSLDGNEPGRTAGSAISPYPPVVSGGEDPSEFKQKRRRRPNKKKREKAGDISTDGGADVPET